MAERGVSRVAASVVEAGLLGRGSEDEVVGTRLSGLNYQERGLLPMPGINCSGSPLAVVARSVG
jgi:hypothetical protein